jgi:hypothetical protein
MNNLLRNHYPDSANEDERIKLEFELFARRWIEEKSREMFPKIGLLQTLTENSQKHWILKQLADRCVHRAQLKNYNQRVLEESLSGMLKFLCELSLEVESEFLKAYRGKSCQESGRSRDEEEIKSAIHWIWHRKDPLIPLREGFDAKEFVMIDYENIKVQFAYYEKNSYLYHPLIDWIFMDAVVTAELSWFGRELKIEGIRLDSYEPDLFEPRSNFNRLYFDAKGNFVEMQKLKFKRWWGKFFKVAGKSILYLIVWPAGILWYLSHINLSGGLNKFAIASCATVVGISTFVMLLIAFWLLFRFLLRVVSEKVFGRPSELAKRLALWLEMYELWKLLKGPVISPMRIKQVMEDTTKKGAAWNNVAWCIVHRMLVENAHTWIFDRNSIDENE